MLEHYKSHLADSKIPQFRHASKKCKHFKADNKIMRIFAVVLLHLSTTDNGGNLAVLIIISDISTKIEFINVAKKVYKK